METILKLLGEADCRLHDATIFGVQSPDQVTPTVMLEVIHLSRKISYLRQQVQLLTNKK